MPMYNLIKHSDVYSKSSGNLWQYYKDEPAIGDDGNNDFPANNNNGNSFQFKQKKNRTAGNSGAKDAEIMLPLKYLSNIRRTLEVPLINCENSLQFK